MIPASDQIEGEITSTKYSAGHGSSETMSFST